ncbi:hypothetical protein IWW38_003267 [Coemansia aciculifera]|uniref:Uncharacterized protein n=1 Tax=Coemansia aciculifera TaxID=417176 RepID=A0ACC1M1T1_9FUNG|nr:hypothetical protein IWW38_003267 [Coemansia aciculifera]
MIESFGVADSPKDISYYASMLLMSFAISQCLTVMYWGRLSDRIGRRPVLAIGLVGTLVVSLLFGVCKTFTAALLVRVAAGVLAGNSAVMQSAMAEIADDTNRSRIMTLLPFTWNVGSMFGSVIGSVFSNPATHFPGWFGNSKLFVYFPYLLPCLIGSAVSAFGLVAGLLTFKETLTRPTQSVQTESAASAEEVLLLAQTAAAPVRQNSMKRLLTPLVVRFMATNIMMYLSFTICDILYQLFAITDPRNGGLGLGPLSLGLLFAAEGIVAIYIQLVAYPRLERKYGVLYCYRRGLSLAIPYLVAMPFLSLIAAHLQSQVGVSPSSILIEKIVMWVLLMSIMTMRATSSVLAFTSINLMVANMAPTRADLGFMNGMLQLVISAVRIFATLVSGSLWSRSIKHSLRFSLNSHLVWILGALFLAILLKLSYRIPDSVNKFAADQPKPIEDSEDLDS